MADIDVERKGPSIWPWIIGLILLGLIIWALAELLGDDNEEIVTPAPVGVVEEPVAPMVPPVTTPGAAPVVAAGTVPPVVQEYVSTCAEPTGDFSLDHQYTSDCIQRLTASIDAVLQNPDLAGVNVQTQLQAYRQRADRLVQSPEMSGEHANMTREAFTSMTDLLDEVQDARYPALDTQIDQLEDTAESVQGNMELLNQRESVQSFFRQAGDVLTAMATTAPTM